MWRQIPAGVAFGQIWENETLYIPPVNQTSRRLRNDRPITTSDKELSRLKRLT